MPTRCMSSVMLPIGAKIVKKAELEDDWGGLMKKKSKSKGGAGSMFDYFQLGRPDGKARIGMGEYVKVDGKQRGRITSDDGTSNPYKVTFDNGQVSGWLYPHQVSVAPKSVTLTDFWASVADYEAVPPLGPLALCVAQVPVYSEPSDATIPMPSDAAGWAVAEMKRLLTSRRMSEWDAVQAACRRASAMKTAASALASLTSSSHGMPTSLVKFVAELTTTDMPIDSGAISRCCAWLATNKHEMMKCKTPLAMIASAAPVVDASINNKAKALDPTLTNACHAALKLMNVHYDEKTAEKSAADFAAKKAEKAAERAVAASKAAAVAASAAAVAAAKKAEARAKVIRARAKTQAKVWAEAAKAWAEARAEAWEAWADAWADEMSQQRKAAVARGRVRESRRRARAAARRGNELTPRSHTSRSCAARTSVRNCARAEECHARDVHRRHSRLAKIADY